VIANITLVIKFVNMHNAKKAGLTELQYWKSRQKKSEEIA
jgi:hypothetical protein